MYDNANFATALDKNIEASCIKLHFGILSKYHLVYIIEAKSLNDLLVLPHVCSS